MRLIDRRVLSCCDGHALCVVAAAAGGGTTVRRGTATVGTSTRSPSAAKKARSPARNEPGTRRTRRLWSEGDDTEPNPPHPSSIPSFHEFSSLVFVGHHLSPWSTAVDSKSCRERSWPTATFVFSWSEFTVFSVSFWFSFPSQVYHVDVMLNWFKKRKCNSLSFFVFSLITVVFMPWLRRNENLKTND